MKILAMSDIHNEFDRFDPATMPDADLCIVAGDITNFGIKEAADFKRSQEWMCAISGKYPIYWIPGNHDLGAPDWSRYPSHPVRPRPTDAYSQVSSGYHCVNLLKGGVFLHLGGKQPGQWVLRGVSLSPAYAMPSLVHQWCLMTSDRREEQEAYDMPYCDILVSHAPPYGVLDESHGRSLGSRALLAYIDRHHPQLVICGHVHNGGGVAYRGATEIHNVACQWRLIEVSQ